MSFLSAVFGCGAKTDDPTILDLPPIQQKLNKEESRPPLPPSSLPPTSPLKPGKERSRKLSSSLAPLVRTQSPGHSAYPHSRKASINPAPPQDLAAGMEARDQSPYRGEPVALGQRSSSGTVGMSSEYNSFGSDMQPNSSGMAYRPLCDYIPQQGPIYPMSQMGHPYGYPVSYPRVSHAYGYGHPGFIPQTAAPVIVSPADWVIYPSQFPSAPRRGTRVENHSHFSDSPASYNANNLFGERQSPSAGNYPVSSDSGQEEAPPVCSEVKKPVKVKLCDADSQTDAVLLIEVSATAATHGISVETKADSHVKDESGTDVRSDECQISETLPQSSPKSDILTEDGQSTAFSSHKMMTSSSPPRPLREKAHDKAQIPKRPARMSQPVTTSLFIARDTNEYQSGQTTSSSNDATFVRESHCAFTDIRNDARVDMKNSEDFYSDVSAAYCETAMGEAQRGGVQMQQQHQGSQKREAVDPSFQNEEFPGEAPYESVRNMSDRPYFEQNEPQIKTQPLSANYGEHSHYDPFSQGNDKDDSRRAPSFYSSTGQFNNSAQQPDHPQANRLHLGSPPLRNPNQPRGQMYSSPDIGNRRMSLQEMQPDRCNTNPVRMNNQSLERNQPIYDDQQRFARVVQHIPAYPQEAHVSMMNVSQLSQESLSSDQCGIEPGKRSAKRQSANRAIDDDDSTFSDHRRSYRMSPGPSQDALDAAAAHQNFGTPVAKAAEQKLTSPRSHQRTIDFWQRKCDKSQNRVPEVPHDCRQVGFCAGASRAFQKPTSKPRLQSTSIVQTTSSTSVPSNSDEDNIDLVNAENLSSKVIDRAVPNLPPVAVKSIQGDSQKSQTRRSSISPACSVRTGVSELVSTEKRRIKVHDSLDADLKTTVTMHFANSPLDFVRMKRDHYAVIDKSIAQDRDKLCPLPRFETQFSLDEPERIISKQLASVRNLSLAHPPKDDSVDDLPGKVLCFVRVRLACGNPEVSIMTRVEVLRHFGSTALRKWLFWGNPTVIDQQGLQRKRALSVTVGQNSERYHLPSGGHIVWKGGEFATLGFFINHFALLSTAKSQVSHRGRRLNL